MADYWKSQTRKYCEFCKCWIADNKPTIQYHENGKRHKENVAKKISEMAKKSAKQYKEKAKVDDEMKKMEEEAMKAYMKDVESKADFTSKLLREKMKKAKEDGSEEEEEDEEEYEEEEKELEGKGHEEVERVNKKAEKSTDKCASAKVWYEGKSEEGYSYYWNIHTNESTWEEPEGGYISLGEQKKEEEKAERAKADAARVAKAKEAFEEKEKGEELRAFIAREAMKRFRPKEEEKKEEEAVSEVGMASFGPAPRVDPYGAWTRVEPVKVKEIDLQLPKSTHPVSYPVVSQSYEPRLVIKEKKLVSGLGGGALDDVEGEVVFKKRKLTGGRSNLRQRTSELDDIE